MYTYMYINLYMYNVHVYVAHVRSRYEHSTIHHSNHYIHSTRVLCDTCTLYCCGYRTVTTIHDCLCLASCKLCIKEEWIFTQYSNVETVHKHRATQTQYLPLLDLQCTLTSVILQKCMYSTCIHSLAIATYVHVHVHCMCNCSIPRWLRVAFSDSVYTECIGIGLVEVMSIHTCIYMYEQS